MQPDETQPLPTMPDVTVIICAYRIGERIRPTIEAVLNQTYSALKLIVIDDASGDDTVDVVKSYRDERLVLVENEQNLGIIDARNKGLSLVETEFVATCDHDDVWAENKLEKQMDYMRQYASCALVGTYWTVYVNGVIDGVRSLPHTTSDYLKWSLYHRNCLLHSSLLMRTRHIKENMIAYRDGIRFADDWKLCLEFAKTGEIGIIPESLVSYYIHGENWSLTARDSMLGNGVALFEQELPLLLDRKVSRHEAETFFHAVAGGRALPDDNILKKVGHTLADIMNAHISTAACIDADKAHIQETASEIWWRVVRTSAGVYGPARLKAYYGSGCPNFVKIGTVKYVSEWVKACVKTLVTKVYH